MSKSRKVQLEKKIMIFLSSGVFIFSGLYASNVQAAPVSIIQLPLIPAVLLVISILPGAWHLVLLAGAILPAPKMPALLVMSTRRAAWRPARSVSEIKRPMKMPALSVMAIMPAV